MSECGVCLSFEADGMCEFYNKKIRTESLRCCEWSRI